MPRRVLIMGAAGRDFHNFNVVYRGRPALRGRRVHRDADPVHRRPDVPGRARRRRATRTASRSTTRAELAAADQRRSRSTTSSSATPTSRHEYVMHQGQRGAGRRRELPAARAERDDARGRRPGRRRLRRPDRARARARRRARSPATLKDAGQARRGGSPPDAVRRTSSAQRVQRFATLEDLDRYDTHDRGARGVRAAHRARARSSTPASTTATILEQAQAECDVLLWDGGNNDLPFYRPTCTSWSPTRCAPGTRRRYHPGEANLRMADVIVDQQDGLGHARAGRPADGRRSRRSNPTRDRREGEQPRHGRRPRRDRAASGCWWSRTARRSRTAR